MVNDSIVMSLVPVRISELSDSAIQMTRCRARHVSSVIFG